MINPAWLMLNPGGVRQSSWGFPSHQSSWTTRFLCLLKPMVSASPMTPGPVKIPLAGTYIIKLHGAQDK